MLSPTLPAHQKGVKGHTLMAQGRQDETETHGGRAAFCVTTGQKLRKVPVINPPPPSPRVWLASGNLDH